MEFLELIKELSLAFGPSGFEDGVLTLVRGYCGEFCDIQEDSMRNLYIYPKYNKGGRPLVMLDAHADEVGFMVQAVKPDGTLKFVPIGGWNEKALPSSKVCISAKKGFVNGIISAIPPHFMTQEQRNAPVTYDSLAIDIGASCAKEAQEAGIDIGCPAVPCSSYEYNAQTGIMMGKAFDDRLGVAVVCEVLKRLQNHSLNVDVVGVISSQEEVGERGIRAVMGKIKPAAAICFEGCPADDTFTPGYLIQDRLRGGVMVRHMDRTVICTPRFVDFAQTTAQKHGVKVQMAVRSGGGNNGAEIIMANGGTPVIVAGVPVRYIHTFNCIAAMEDVVSNVDLGVALCRDLDGDIIGKF